jgi:hypothetical protein
MGGLQLLERALEIALVAEIGALVVELSRGLDVRRRALRERAATVRGEQSVDCNESGGA